MDTRSNHNALAFDVTHRLVLAIAIPMTLGFMTTPLLGLTNTAVVGRMGNAEALAGLAIGAMLFDLILGSFNFLRASTTGLTAQAYGRRDQHEQQAVFARAMISALGCGLALLCLSPLLMAAGLRLMGAEGAIAEATGTYFSIRMLAAPAALANYAILGFVLGRGQGNIGLLLQAIINGINILLSIYLGLSLDWGVAGVAWGTMAGETVGALAGLFIVLRGFGKAARPAWSEVFSRHRLAELFALNRDILIRTFVLIGAFTIMTRIGTSFGAVTLAANAVVMNFFLLSGYYLDGLANAAEQIIGRAIGAHYRPAFDRGLKLTTLWSFGLAAIGSAFFFLAGPWLISVLTTSPEVRQAAETYLPWAAVTGLTGALAFLMDGVFIGATWSADMRNRMLISFAGYLLMLAVFVPLFGNHGLWLAMNAFLLFRGFFLAMLVKPRADQTFRAAQ
ncbi:MATE family efflux transporter [Rhizobium leguminosarum]|uniref:MATE family efflux transporter n=1 Tax=Rhizobium leguminosarum TaxID=384 RepID=UPI001441A81F|nr:MATE family efflux transporter [Rhizobium leguminosarum]MBA9031195.1 MATE family multidrug resistance protein [Rhizobium leguminosarum]MBY5899655.1 MATE family efflux transporter [Rhizobium leguminosarum]MBY5905857.1 MATE family efflux transporter [Rhizobium leguminosarum]MDI5924291.1 MATE family efflux transporter [Rhizobium leguminosarum]NKK89779.1 MATE family efflux transporter [Rhizobium leguminosarum bv. viciae]